MATRRNPGGPKERHVRVANKKAATMPDIESPEIKIGVPRTKITILDKMADCHVVGLDCTRLIAFEIDPIRSFGDAFAVRNSDILVGL